jgi:Cof subfamily protein (haloacid dehalogenase superfamily)
MQDRTRLPLRTEGAATPATIQLLVLDIDGTIAGETNQIRPAVLEAIAAVQAKGVEVAIATGRMYCAALRFHQAVGSRLPLIAYQGALIQDPNTARIHRHWTLAKPTVLELLAYFEQVEFAAELSIHLYIDDQLYVRELTPATQAYAQRSGVKAIAVGDLRRVLDQPATKLLALCDDSSRIEHLLSHLKQRYTPAELYLTTSVATFFEAAHPLVSKGEAVRYLAEEVLGLSAAQVMTIGDNFNDLEMLEYAGIGVAMGNAPDPVKAIANWVAPDVEADGAAAAIQTFLLSAS